jgi:hypothetical protein
MKLGLVETGSNQSLSYRVNYRFSIPLIFLLSNLVSMFPRASGTIMDNSLHVSSHSYASLSRAPVKLFLAQMDPLDYPLYDAYSNHVTASESFSITSGYGRNLQNLQNPLGCWFRALGVCKYYMISLFVKKLLLNACLAHTAPNIVQILHSWIPKTGFKNVLVWKCWFSDVLFWHRNWNQHPFSNFKVLKRCPPTSISCWIA